MEVETMLNISQEAADNLSPDAQVAVAGFALNAANATIQDLADQLAGARVLLRAKQAALRVADGQVSQLVRQVKEQAATIRLLKRTVCSKNAVAADQKHKIEIQGHQLDKLMAESAVAQAAIRGYPLMVNMLVLDAMWEPLLGDHAAEIDMHIRNGGEELITAIRQIRAATGFNTLLCKDLVQMRAEYL
jgi:hypothetical protein